jgi:hypothetical protein
LRPRPTSSTSWPASLPPKFDTLEPFGAFDLKPDNHLALF